MSLLPASPSPPRAAAATIFRQALAGRCSLRQLPTLFFRTAATRCLREHTRRPRGRKRREESDDVCCCYYGGRRTYYYETLPRFSGEESAAHSDHHTRPRRGGRYATRGTQASKDARTRR